MKQRIKMNKNIGTDNGDILDKLFSFKGVMNRKEYLIYGILFPIILIGLGGYLASTVAEGKIFLIFVFLGAIAQLATTVKRARDRHENIVILIIALFAFSPIVILYLLLAPAKELEEVKKQKSSVLLYILLGITLFTIIGLVLPKLLSNSGEDAREKLVCINMKSVSNDLKMFKLDMDRYPSTEEGFELLLTNSYLSGYPLDSWGHELKYINKNDNFELISAGRDGIKSSDDILFSECH
jgi:general secretion pathway protein G